MENKIFDEKFISEMRRVSSTDARAVSLKKMLLFVTMRCAELEAKLQTQIDELKENGK